MRYFIGYDLNGAAKTNVDAFREIGFYLKTKHPPVSILQIDALTLFQQATDLWTLFAAFPFAV